MPDRTTGESWQQLEERIRSSSPHGLCLLLLHPPPDNPKGSKPGWKLISVIVKSRDDLRQEQFAVQVLPRLFLRRLLLFLPLFLWLLLLPSRLPLRCLYSSSLPCPVPTCACSRIRCNRLTLSSADHSLPTNLQEGQSPGLASALPSPRNVCRCWSTWMHLVPHDEKLQGSFRLSMTLSACTG